MVTRAEGYELYKGEYQYVDGVETVTYRIDTDTVDASVSAKRMELSKLGSTFDPADLELTDIAWIVYAVTLGEPMQKGATLTDSAGTKFKIRSFTSEKFDTEFHCLCARLPNVS